MSVYMATDGKGAFLRTYKGRSGFGETWNIEDAKRWNKAQTAINVCGDLPGLLRGRFHVVEAVGPAEFKAVVGQPMDIVNPIMEAVDSSPFMVSTCEQWQCKIEGAMGFIAEADNRLRELNAALSKTDLELTDLEHYIEFNTLNASRGYEAYRKMHELLLRRRGIKDELQIVSGIKSSVPSMPNFQSMLKALKAVEKQKYRPRVLKDLFE